MSDKERTCHNCVKSKLCFAYITINEALMKLPAAKSKFDTPGTEHEVIDALAISCREYQEKKQ